MTVIPKLAKILRCREETLLEVSARMGSITGKTDVLDQIVEENERRMSKFLDYLAIQNRSAEDIFSTMSYNLKRNERFLEQYFDSPDLTKPESLGKIFVTAREITIHPKGTFLKKESARKMLRNTPPPNMMRYFGYHSGKELIEKENISEVYAALRFVETREWMNDIFLKNYTKLTPSDFEKRDIELIALPTKWLDVARDFIKKKYHNVSHLKELGTIFVIPIRQEGQGEILRVFTLILHYFYEVEFYSKLLERYLTEEDFTGQLISFLRGDVPEPGEPQPSKTRWLIVQRYLAKENKNDPRLFLPHINPEALHWEKAEDALAYFAKNLEGTDLNFWRGYDWVGDFFPSVKEGELLVSFDLIDNIMSLVMEKELIKYLYHHQEALWNKILKEYIGRQKLEELLVGHFNREFIEF